LDIRLDANTQFGAFAGARWLSDASSVAPETPQRCQEREIRK
jgi:hypothetical protein